MSKLRVLDLFSGIGGFSLGLERTGGFSTVAFCEIEPFPRRVLAKHWPEVPCYDDVRTLTAERLRADGICVDVICGGFPCQDISVAGAGAGITDGTRSGLWSEIARLVGELRPDFVLVENSSALLGRGLGRVLGDLAALGYDAEWHCIPASALGAPHQRDRVWIVAYPNDTKRGAQHSARQRLAWRTPYHNGSKVQIDLAQAVKLWPTPTVCGNYNRKGASKTSVNGLATAVRLWTTPCADDTGHRRKKYAQGGTPLSMQAGGPLNPVWVEWLMGFPLGWTELPASATRSSRRSRS